MSEHYEGKLICVDAGDQTEFDLDTEDGWTIATAGRGNARRIAAAWNAVEGSKTEVLEALGADFVKPLIDLIDDKERLSKELNAARALLREVLDGRSSDYMDKKIRSHLDACDTLEGK